MTTAVATQGKTITATQRRAIEKLIKNDFDALENDLFDFEQAEFQRITEKYRASCEAYEAKVTKVVERANARLREQIAKIEADALDAGFSVSFYRLNDVEVRNVYKKDEQDAEQREKQELSARAKAARSALRRRRLNLERDLIMATLTNEAAVDFISQIPTLKELMENAQPAIAG